MNVEKGWEDAQHMPGRLEGIVQSLTEHLARPRILHDCSPISPDHVCQPMHWMRLIHSSMSRVKIMPILQHRPNAAQSNYCIRIRPYVLMLNVVSVKLR
jgi:hypothetical protein